MDLEQDSDPQEIQSVSAKLAALLPAQEGDRPGWIEERIIIILKNPVGGYNRDYAAYWDSVLRASQEALDGSTATAVTFFRRVECWDFELMDQLGKAIMIAPLPNELRRAALLAAVKMADAYRICLLSLIEGCSINRCTTIETRIVLSKPKTTSKSRSLGEAT